MKDEKAQFGTVLNRLRAGIVVHEHSSRIRYANERAAGLLGWAPDQLEGVENDDPRWVFCREDGSSMPVSEYPASRALYAGEIVEDLILGLRRSSDHHLVWLICNAEPVLDGEGRVLEAVVSFTDITQLKSMERALFESEQRLRLVIEGSNDASWDIDLVNGVPFFSARWWTMLGHDPGSMTPSATTWRDYLHPEDRDRALDSYQRALDDGSSSFQIEYRLLHAYGHYVPILSRGLILRSDTGQAVRVSGTNMDLTERKMLEQQAYQLAFFDGLTALPNRQLLVEQIQKAILGISRSKRLAALLLINLDRFKIYNDTLGHGNADALLKQIAARLRASVRDADSVGRLGGDEFVVLLEHLSGSVEEAAVEAEQMGEIILEQLQQPYSVSGDAPVVTASVGIAIFDGSDTSASSVLRQADLAMYEAKSKGGGTLRFFDLKMQITVDERLDLERQLRKAVLADELRLFYQLQVSVEGRVLGAEALLRWQHPERGMIMPSVFIPVAESSSLIVQIGAWALQTACRQLQQWADHPVFSRLSLSVNVSVRQFNEADFVNTVLSVLDQTGADPRKLKLEITESLVAKDIEAIIAKMATLKQIGIGFSLDDFGTGYSSLFYLQRMPLNEVKIDRAFVQEILTNPHHRDIARIIILLADTLELSVIAEGVEDEGQRQFLEDSGCHAYQGYLFGPPTTVAMFESETLRRNGR
jgi:diguanylate cyclase (GGDEF)-like protein/PAS domain S-box-containing protein